MNPQRICLLYDLYQLLFSFARNAIINYHRLSGLVIDMNFLTMWSQACERISIIIIFTIRKMMGGSYLRACVFLTWKCLCSCYIFIQLRKRGRSSLMPHLMKVLNKQQDSDFMTSNKPNKLQKTSFLNTITLKIGSSVYEFGRGLNSCLNIWECDLTWTKHIYIY